MRKALAANIDPFLLRDRLDRAMSGSLQREPGRCDRRGRRSG
jgi:hypothetical protein